MRTRSIPFRRGSLFAAPILAAATLLAPSCTDSNTAGVGGAAGTAGAAGGVATLPPGELCTPPSAEDIRLRFEPSTVFVSTCAAGTACPARQVRIVVDPDLCPSADGSTPEVPVPATVTLTTTDASIAPAPGSGTVGVHQATALVDVRGGTTAGTTTLTAHLPTLKSGSGGEITAQLTVVANDPTLVACSNAESVSVAALKPAVATGGGVDNKLYGQHSLKGASIGLQAGADAPVHGSFLWHVDAFPATISCAADLAPPGEVALGPAVTFGPSALTFRREIPLSIPINPALMPAKARLRHLHVVYSGPGLKAPRTVTVADPRIELVGPEQGEKAWALTFKAPRLGTYQAVVASDAGTRTRKRRITHRAIMGISMGGGGTATFGMRHHDKFDVLAPLGGPVNWTWMLDYIEKNHLGGFRSIPKGTTLADLTLTAPSCMTDQDCKPDETCLGVLTTPATAGKCRLMPKAAEPYLHPQTFNSWWAEYPRTGNGGSFARADYLHIFRDLSLMYGNPNGENLSPGGESLPAGVNPDDRSVVGDHPNGECRVWVEPIDPGANATDAEKQAFADQQKIAASCPVERCAHPLSLSSYYDDEFNPDGVFPVISVCDGSAQNDALSPYANTWTPQGNGDPLEVALAVDYNGNGVRDEMEPIVRAGHEPWSDFGADGMPSALEPGYVAGVNDDPAGDDYDAQYNPTGTEGNHRLDAGEKYEDVGLDGVAGTAQQPPTGWSKPGDGYDVGEADGKFTVSRGLQRFWDRDPYSIARRLVDPEKVPGGELTDAALARLDVWTDGGTRDLFNFAVGAQHLVGGFSARGRDAVYLTNFSQVAGLAGDVPDDPAHPNGPKHAGSYLPSHTSYEDLQGIVLQRYGAIDPTDEDIESGSGQHVGSAPELISRLEGALYFIGSRWREPSLVLQNSASADKPIPGAPGCEVEGTCRITFPPESVATTGRRGPVSIVLPPGYANEDLKSIRYPVIYVLHGYGQEPKDLEGAVALLANWMNNPLDSGATRLPKAIVVFVDGRCRVVNGRPECLRGTFFADSPREDGAQDERWWLQLMDYVDQHYRTLGETEIDWTE